MDNIILIGMPGSGKTVIGQKTAQILGRRFVDADAVLEAKAGITIPEIFAKYGEESFRRLETEVLNDIGKTGGQVLSTGGGTVLRPENYAPLRQNGRIYLIKRDREKLAVSGRPLSKSPEALAEMERIRGPYYAAFADAAIQNDKTVEDACLLYTSRCV